MTAPRALCWRTLVRKLTRSIRMIGWALVATFNASIIAATAGLPPPPPNHCNDFAGVIRPETVARLNRELVQFERETSNQIIVAIYQRLPAQSAPDEYAVRLAQHWQVGRKDRKNGAVLFAFQESHDLRIVTGYGLEGTLPDALCKRILETEIIPRFRTGNFDAGLTAGVHAMMAATRGEYRGSNQNRAAADGAGPLVLQHTKLGLPIFSPPFPTCSLKNQLHRLLVLVEWPVALEVLSFLKWVVGCLIAIN